MSALLVEAEQNPVATASRGSGLPGESNNCMLLLANTKLSSDDGKDGFTFIFEHLIMCNVDIRAKSEKHGESKWFIFPSKETEELFCFMVLQSADLDNNESKVF